MKYLDVSKLVKENGFSTGRDEVRRPKTILNTLHGDSIIVHAVFKRHVTYHGSVVRLQWAFLQPYAPRHPPTAM
jgi:hypothetical protein